LLLQRIRNRVIDYLELAASFEEQLDYQKNVPIAHVPDEIINEWDDCASLSFQPDFIEPVFSASEQQAVRQFHAVWDAVANETPDPLPALESLQLTPEWIRLRDSAKVALSIFQIRGRLSDDVELA
jgi:hypothetical protein